MLPNIWVLTATCGRHTCLERSVRCFLDQDYEGEHTMFIYNNSEVEQFLHLPKELPSNKHIKLLNQSRNILSGEKYKTLGEIYNDMITFIPEDVEVVSFWDDDDLFLPNHIRKGIEGYQRVRSFTVSYNGYKPATSFYRSVDGISEVSNTLEPSIFVSAQHIKNYGFSNTTSDQHHQWLSKANIYIDKDGTPTLIYNWGDKDIPTWKTSGDPGNPENFNNYRNFSQDHGDKIISPIGKERVLEIYRLANTVKI